MDCDPAKVRVTMFGGLMATGIGGAQLVFRTRKTASLFCHLAINLGRNLSRDSVCMLLWPQSEESFARNSLSVSLTSLRKQVEHDTGASHQVLVGDGRSISLSYDYVWCDVVEFYRRLKKATLLEKPEDRLRALFDALDLYEGPLLPEDDEPWARSERFRCEQEFQQALCQVLDMAKEEPDMHRALNHAMRALVWDRKNVDVRDRVDRLRQRLGLQEKLRFKKTDPGVVSEGGDAKVLHEIQRLLDDCSEPAPASAGEHLGGAVPLDSPYYLDRRADGQLVDCVDNSESVVLIKGPRQIGKSSLLARGMARGRSNGALVLLSDVQSADSDSLTSIAAFYQWLISTMLDQLGRSERAEVFWDELRAPALNLERFIKQEVLSHDGPVFWGLDEVDRLFSCPYYSDFFGLLRSWHNRRAMEPKGPWNKLTLAITYATEVHALIKDINQSPFNVGIILELLDFDLKQVAELNQRYGQPLRNLADIQDFFGLFGGHPFLVRRALYELSNGDISFAELKQSAAELDGPFADHLKRMIITVRGDRMLHNSMCTLLRGKEDEVMSTEPFHRLRSAGIVKGKSPKLAEIRCGLYMQCCEANL
jgi:DNA-binding SARP family transcriptional activator